MKTKLIILFLLITTYATAQIRFGEVEKFKISMYVDPHASHKAKGLDFGGDIEYNGIIIAKAGFESFAALEGNYFDIHGTVAPRLTIGQFEQISLYAGLRLGVVFRNGGVNPIAGAEAGVDYEFQNGLFVGIAGSYVYRCDMKAMQWKEIWRENVALRVGYSWDW